MIAVLLILPVCHFISDKESPDNRTDLLPFEQLKAYIPPDSWQTLLNDLGLKKETLNSRYDVVCHLVTAGA